MYTDFIKFIDNLFIISFSYYLVEFENDEKSDENIKIFNEWL